MEKSYDRRFPLSVSWLVAWGNVPGEFTYFCVRKILNCSGFSSGTRSHLVLLGSSTRIRYRGFVHYFTASSQVLSYQGSCCYAGSKLLLH